MNCIGKGGKCVQGYLIGRHDTTEVGGSLRLWIRPNSATFSKK